MRDMQHIQLTGSYTTRTGRTGVTYEVSHLRFRAGQRADWTSRHATFIRAAESPARAIRRLAVEWEIHDVRVPADLDDVQPLRGREASRIRTRILGEIDVALGELAADAADLDDPEDIAAWKRMQALPGQLARLDVPAIWWERVSAHRPAAWGADDVDVDAIWRLIDAVDAEAKRQPVTAETRTDTERLRHLAEMGDVAAARALRHATRRTA